MPYLKMDANKYDNREEILMERDNLYIISWERKIISALIFNTNIALW